MPFRDKLLTVDDFIAHWKQLPPSKKLVFTNGVFDLLHLGHITYLEEANALGSHLIVGLNSDESTRNLNKGTSRPIQDENSRALILAALESVDFVVIFNDSTPLELISRIKPDVLVKGGDYDHNQLDENQIDFIVGSKEVKGWGGEVKALDVLEGYSTTNIEAKIRSNGED